ncbi:MAG TPA: prolipoprotein diacylglyceryl transferase family protein [Candidatus Limnocylindrales bacterium]
MPIALIAFDFDPVLRFAGGAVRLETLGVAVAILVALLIAARIAVGTRVSVVAAGESPRLRIDDLVFVVLGVVPGAVTGGRLGYVLLHLDYYAANRGAIFDPGQGSLELAVAVLGGALTGGLAARLLGEPVAHWFHVAALPTVAGIALGKLAMAIGGSGQGAPAAVSWATSYLGPGPWGSLGASIPSHPSQVYEAIAAGLIVIAMIAAMSAGVFRRRDGLAFVVAVGGWAAARGVVAATWRDALVAGPFGAEQLICLAVACASLAVGAVLVRRAGAVPRSEAAWPEAEATRS